MQRDALAPFYDHDLDQRVALAKVDWQARAQQMLDAAIGPDRLAQIQANAAVALVQLQEQVDALDVRVDVEGVEFPAFAVPDPMASHTPVGLVDSEWDFTDQCRALIASKKYEPDDGAPQSFYADHKGGER